MTVQTAVTTTKTEAKMNAIKRGSNVEAGYKWVSFYFQKWPNKENVALLKNTHKKYTLDTPAAESHSAMTAKRTFLCTKLGTLDRQYFQA